MIRFAALLGVAFALLGAGAARGASGVDTFRTPSGNVSCAYAHFSGSPVELRCDIRSGVRPLPARPTSCTLDWGVGYVIRQRGPARVLCAGDTVADPKATVLAYGTTRQLGVFVCASSRAGLRCVNSTGDGFFMSRGRSYTFKQRAPRNGAFKTPSGNIVCGYTIGSDGLASMECGVKSGLRPPPHAIHCQAGDPNDKRVSLTANGRAVPVRCAGDPGPFLVERTAVVLVYGRTWSGGGISCTSAATGLTCRNRAGHGFFLSRERWRSF